MRFTKAEAIEICQRELYYNPFKNYNDCYYFDGECELNLKDCSRNCLHFKTDIPFTNMIRKAILDDPEYCRRNWKELCRVDRELFITIYGVKEVIHQILIVGRYCKVCGAELPKYDWYNGDGTSFVVCPRCNKQYVHGKRRFDL